MAVRRESVRLELEDNFSKKMLTAAAATKALEGSLRDLDGTSLGTGRSIDRTAKSTDSLSQSAVRGSSQIDRFSGRMGILLKVGAALGPALIPISAVAIPAVTGLANQLGFAAIAAGTAVLAFQGVGDALTAVNKASLDPTVENLRAAHQALQMLSPAGRDFVAQLDSMRPIVADLRNTASEGLFPGLVEGFESLERLAPSVNRILGTVSSTLGDLFAEGAASLSGDKFADFFSMIATESRPVLTDMGHALGSVVHGLSEMWEAFQPLNRDFGSWLADTAASFDDWSTGLSETEGFKDFIAYVRENGPVVAEAAGAIGNAIVQIVQATAPLGGPVLKAITAFADAIALIADSPLGTPIMAAVTAMSALSLASNVATASVARTSAAMATLGVTSKKAGVTGAAASGAGAGGPWGMAIAAMAVNFMHMKDNIDQASAALDGDMGDSMDAYQDRMDRLSLTDPMNWLSGDGVRAASEDMWSLVTTGETITHKLQGEAAKWGTLGESMPWSEARTQHMATGLTALGNTFETVAEGGDGFTRSMIRQARAAEQTAARVVRLKDASSAHAEVMSAAASSFTDFNVQVKASNFTLDGYLDRMERERDATQRWVENAERAVEKGLDLDYVERLKTMGREGKLLLKEYADATAAEIGRANRWWDSHTRTVSKHQQKLDALRLKTTALGGKGGSPKLELLGFEKTQAQIDVIRAKLGLLGGEKPTPKIELLGADHAQQSTAQTRAKLTALGGVTAKPKIVVSSNADAAAAAAAAALNRVDGDVARSSIIVTTYHNSVHRAGSSTSDGTGPQLWSGGYTGPGGKYQAKGTVHAEEVVIPRELVRRDRALLMARYGHLPGMHALGNRASERAVGSRGPAVNVTAAATDLSGVERRLISVERAVRQMGGAQVAATDRQTHAAKAGASSAARANKGGW